MTLARVPHVFATGETLSPSRINSNFEAIARDVKDVMDQRFSYSSFTLEWVGIADTADTELRSYYIQAPYAWEVVGVELVGYDGASVTCTLSATGFTSGWENVAVAMAGANTRAKQDANFVARAAAEANVKFTLSVSGTATIDRCYAVIHIRADRGNAGQTYTEYRPSNALRVLPGAASSASELNTEFSTIETSVSQASAATRQMRIQVFTRRSFSSTVASDRAVRVPATGMTLRRLALYVVGAVGPTVTGAVLDETSTGVSSLSLATTGATSTASINGNTTDTQSFNDPDDTADDYYLRFTHSGVGTVNLAYLVVFWG